MAIEMPRNCSLVDCSPVKSGQNNVEVGVCMHNTRSGVVYYA